MYNDLPGRFGQCGSTLLFGVPIKLTKSSVILRQASYRMTINLFAVCAGNACSKASLLSEDYWDTLGGDPTVLTEAVCREPIWRGEKPGYLKKNCTFEKLRFEEKNWVCWVLDKQNWRHLSRMWSRFCIIWVYFDYFQSSKSFSDSVPLIKVFVTTRVPFK